MHSPVGCCKPGSVEDAWLHEQREAARQQSGWRHRHRGRARARAIPTATLAAARESELIWFGLQVVILVRNVKSL